MASFLKFQKLSNVMLSKERRRRQRSIEKRNIRKRTNIIQIRTINKTIREKTFFSGRRQIIGKGTERRRKQ